MKATLGITDEAMAESDKIFKLLVDHAKGTSGMETVDLIQAIAMAALGFSCGLTQPGYELESIKRYREFTNALCDDFAESVVEKTDTDA